MSKEAIHDHTSSHQVRKSRFGWKLVSLVAAVIGFGVGGGLYYSNVAVPVEVPLPQPSQQFDGQQAYAYLKAICDLGPRISDTRAMHHQQQILRKHFESLGAQVRMQSFLATQPSLRGRKFTCSNLIVHWHPNAKRRVLIGCHYDTRPIADREPILRNRRDGEFLGANDGASGVALLMELGKQMPALKTEVGVDFIFFDAEEYIFDASRDKYFIGSEGFVQEYREHPPGYRYEKVVVVDMIADAELEIHPDQRSAVQAGRLVQEVFSIAEELGFKQFNKEPRYDILDDHIAFQEAGIPAIVLIDFAYPHWHRLSDTPDKCSPESLHAVGSVVAEWIRRQK